jgi:hypothetical protein
LFVIPVKLDKAAQILRDANPSFRRLAGEQGAKGKHLAHGG